MKYLIGYLLAVIAIVLLIDYSANYAPVYIKIPILFIVVFGCVYISSLMFFNQVVQKVNPVFSDKKAMMLSIVISILFALGAVLYGGGHNPLNEFN